MHFPRETARRRYTLEYNLFGESLSTRDSNWHNWGVAKEAFVALVLQTRTVVARPSLLVEVRGGVGAISGEAMMYLNSSRSLKRSSKINQREDFPWLLF